MWYFGSRIQLNLKFHNNRSFILKIQIQDFQTSFNTSINCKVQTEEPGYRYRTLFKTHLFGIRVPQNGYFQEKLQIVIFSILILRIYYTWVYNMRNKKRNNSLVVYFWGKLSLEVHKNLDISFRGPYWKRVLHQGVPRLLRNLKTNLY